MAVYSSRPAYDADGAEGTGSPSHSDSTSVIISPHFLNAARTGVWQFDLSGETGLDSNATINSAYMKLTSATTWGDVGRDGPSMTALDTGDQVAISSNVNERPRDLDTVHGLVSSSVTFGVYDDEPGGSPTLYTDWTTININDEIYTADLTSVIEDVLASTDWDTSDGFVNMWMEGYDAAAVGLAHVHESESSDETLLVIDYTAGGGGGGTISFDITQTGDSTAAGTGGGTPADAPLDHVLSTAAGPLTYTDASSTAYLETVVGTTLSWEVNQTGSAPTFGDHVGVTNPESGALYNLDDRVENLTMTPLAWTNSDNSTQATYLGYVDSMEAAGYNGAIVPWSEAGNSYDGATTNLTTVPGDQNPADWYQVCAWWFTYKPNFAQYCGVYMTAAQVNDSANHTAYVQAFTFGPLLLTDSSMDVVLMITTSGATSANIAALCSTWQSEMGSRRLVIELPDNTTTYTTGEVATIAAQVDGIWIRFTSLGNSEEEVTFAEVETTLDHYNSTATLYAGASFYDDYDERLDVVRQAAQKNGLYHYIIDQWALHSVLNAFNNDRMVSRSFSASVDVAYGETELLTEGAVNLVVDQTGDADTQTNNSTELVLIPQVEIVTSQTATSEAIGIDTDVHLLGIAGATRDFEIAEIGDSEAIGDLQGGTGTVVLGTDDERIDIPNLPATPSIPTTG